MAYQLDILDSAGVKQATLTERECSARVRRTLSDEWSIEITYPIPPSLEQGLDKSAYLWAYNARARIINLLDSTDYQTFTLGKPTKRKNEDGMVEVVATGDHIAMKTMATEVINAHFEFKEATPDYIMSVLFDAGHTYSSYHKGTVGPTTPITVTISYETVLSALRKIVDAVEGDYDVDEANAEIDLLAAKGSVNSVNIRDRKNLKSIQVTRFSLDIINKMFGAGGGEVPATIAGARHVLTYVSGATIRCAPFAIAEDDSWNTYKVQFVTGAAVGESIVINDCAHGATYDQFTLASAPSSTPAVGDKFTITTAAGVAVDFIRAGASITSYTQICGVYKNQKYLDTINLVKTPALDGTYAAGLCENWTKSGTPTVTENTTAAYNKFGAKSQRIQATSDGQGINQAVAITAGLNHSVQAYVYIVSGTVRMRLTIGSNYYDADPESRTGWQKISVPVIRMSASPVTVALFQSGGPATEFYVSGVQVTQTEQEREFTPNSDPSSLWKETFLELMNTKDPVVEYRCNFADLNRMFPRDYPFDAIAIGDTVVVSDADLGLSSVSLRVKEMNYSVFEPESVEHTVTNA